MKICNKYQDIANKWRVQVEYDGLNTLMLKFQDEPTDEEVFIEAEETLIKLAQIAEDQRIEDEKRLLAEEIAESLYVATKP